MYKIEVLDNCQSYKFIQLTYLIKNFAINVFMVQKFNLINDSNAKKEKYIDNYTDYLSDIEIQTLKKDIQARIDFATNSIKSKNKDKQTRYYILMDEDKVIAFQTAQVRKENNRIEGWRNFAYTENDYKGKSGEVLYTSGKVKIGILSNLIYENITEWFTEENVEIEKTATGKNMLKNIKIYILKKKFIPESIDNTRVYLIKDYKDIKQKSELKHIYEKYISEFGII